MAVVQSRTGATVGVVGAGDADVLLDGPLGAVLLAGGGATSGAAAFVVHTLAPRALGAPVHTHTREDEWSFVLEGSIGIELGGEDHTAGAGELVLKPRGVPHAFWNAGDAPARLLEVITPSGFEDYFTALGPIVGAGGPPDPDALVRLAEDFGVEMDIASLPRLVRDHDLVLR